MIFKDPRPFLRPLRWATALLLPFGMLLSLNAPLDEWQRWEFRLLIVLLGIYVFAMTDYVMPRFWARAWMIYANIVVTCAVIGVIDYLLHQVDLTPLYLVVILAAAMLWDRRAALFAAALATILKPGVALLLGVQPPAEIGLGLIDPSIYFVSALLVSQLTHALTHRWQAAAAEAAEQGQELKRRNEELAGLDEIGQAFGSLDDLPTAFRQVTERIARLLNAEMCLLARFEFKAGRVYGMPPGFGLTDQEIENFQYQVDRKIVEFWDITKNEHLILNDLAGVPATIAQYAQSIHLRQVVAARMMWRGMPTGMIFVANRRDGRPFGEEDAHLLGILAGQGAMVTENVRLYREAQTSLSDVTRLYAISTELAAQSNPDKIPMGVVLAAAEALNAPAATIALLDESTGNLEYVATFGVPDVALKLPFRENGVAMTVLRTGKPRFVEDTQAAQDVSPLLAGVWSLRAFACLPIQHGEKRIGVLYVDHENPHTFTPIEKTVLAIFANQSAIALENAQLLRAEKRKSAELAALASLSRSLAETMDLKEIFRVIEREVRAGIPAADAGALLIYNPRGEVLVPRAAFGFDLETIARIALRPGESIPGTVFQANAAMLFSGTDAVKEARQSMRPGNRALLAAGTHLGLYPQAVLCAPVRSGGETIGVIVLDNFKSPQGFTQEDLQLLEAMANRVALAIRNAQLYEREQHRAAQLAIVNELGHRVTSILDMDQLALTLVRLIRDKFGYRYVHLFINDPLQRAAVLRAGAAPVDTQPVPVNLALQFNQGIVGWVAAHGEAITANDVSQEPRFVYHPAVADTRAELAVPLGAGGRVIGVLDIQSEQLDAFDQSDVSTLETLAGQLAIAIENARLYGKMEDQAHRDSLTQVYNHSYFLQRLSEEVERARRESKPLTLIMLDVDYFKEYNDRYGHVTGDAVLSTIVQAIRSHVHETDLVGRWGGEEFGIALLHVDLSAAIQVSERIRQTLAETRVKHMDGRQIPPPTISQGLATFPTHAQDTASLIDRADAALYSAKSRGRDQVSVTCEER
ncbi:MAG: GAF domain-containing protein [Chloroflexota bacterium]|nr:GAF domain-containing protein [Chloroflexota bacterium]